MKVISPEQLQRKGKMPELPFSSNIKPASAALI
jgi:hypothetical protein